MQKLIEKLIKSFVHINEDQIIDIAKEYKFNVVLYLLLMTTEYFNKYLLSQIKLQIFGINLRKNHLYA